MPANSRSTGYRLLFLPAFVIVYLVVTLHWHQDAIKDYNRWCAQQRVASPVVYITYGGGAYHTYSHYGARSQPISLFDAVRSHHYACTVCQPVTLPQTEEQRIRTEPSYIGYGAGLILGLVILFVVIASTFPSVPTRAPTRIA